MLYLYKHYETKINIIVIKVKNIAIYFHIIIVLWT